MISIVTGYYNRKNLFYETLLSITRSKYKDIELIAVDDGSSPEHRLEDLVEEFPFLKIIRLEKENKWYVNSCVPLNIGIREAKGDIVLLQNPECLHVHDVLTYVSENINDSNYIALSAYGLDPITTSLLPEYRNEYIVDLLKSMIQRPYTGGSAPGWYNHSIYRRVYYHFCSAMTKNNIMKLRGFDERYAPGIGYDDDELIVRIRRLGLKLTIEDKISVMHQYHDTFFWNMPNAASLTERNQALLLNVTLKENTYEVNQDDNWGKTYRHF
jgi:glycosyltransferase involved in cell wall biosynthesis